MSRARGGRTGGFARRSVVLCALTLAGVGGVPEATAKAAPTIELTPTSGTPGSMVDVRGRGFCAVAGCSAVTILFAGTPVAQDVRPAGDGAFRARFRVPGGGVVGAANVTVTQTATDGNEIRAFATYDLVFGIGEEAEVQADINDLVAQPPGSPLPEGPPRGVPADPSAEAAMRESEAAQARDAANERETDSSPLAVARRAVARDGVRAAVVAAVSLAALAAFVLRRRRARRA